MALKTVVIFGTFDGIHKGHLEFIRQARKQGDRLVVIIARDNVVKELKKKIPAHNEMERLDTVLNIEEIDQVFLGDSERGTYKTLKEINPDIIFLGYDQQDLHNDIFKKIESDNLPKMELLFGKPYQPELFKSSILNK